MRQLHQGILVVEGDWDWSRKGFSRKVLGDKEHGSEFTIAQFNGVQLSAQVNGIWVVSTPDQRGTEIFLEQLPVWLDRDNHLSLLGKPKARGRWGTPTSEEWQSWVWQSWDGVGPKLAGALVKAVGLPLRFTVSREELQKVPGIGRVKATTIWQTLGGENEDDGEAQGQGRRLVEAVEQEGPGS